MDFNGKVVLITGASSGIGVACAEKFAKFGADLTLIGRNKDNLSKAMTNCKKINNNVKVIALQADVTKDAEYIIDEVVSNFGRVDVLVNNAGILEIGSIENTSLEQYDRVMNTNIRAMYHLTMLSVPHLIKAKGSVVNVSSVNGLRSFPGVLAYCVSKAAVDQFTHCVALELAGKGVRCNAVNPGVIITEIHKRGGMDEEAYKKFLENSKNTHALGRPGHVDEVASTITFLASDKASFITGASIPVDGGRHAMVNKLDQQFRIEK